MKGILFLSLTIPRMPVNLFFVFPVINFVYEY